MVVESSARSSIDPIAAALAACCRASLTIIDARRNAPMTGTPASTQSFKRIEALPISTAPHFPARSPERRVVIVE
jgi:hypothetical protein